MGHCYCPNYYNHAINNIGVRRRFPEQKHRGYNQYAQYPEDKRPREAIEAAKKCIENDTPENRAAARAAAWAAARAAWAAEAADAAAWAAALTESGPEQMAQY